MKIFNMSPWLVLALFLGSAAIVGLGVGAFTYRNLPGGLHAEYAVTPADFLTVDANLALEGKSFALHGVVRCRFNPYPGLSDKGDFSFPDAISKQVEPGRQMILVLGSLCSENAVEQGKLHFTVIDRHGDDATIYATDSPQLAGSAIKVRKTESADFAQGLDDYLDECDAEGFSDPGRIGVWHLPGESFVGDMVSALGPPPPSNQIEKVSNYIDNSVGDQNITAMLRDWKVRPVTREETRVCASNESFLGKGCAARMQMRAQAYALESIDGGAMPAIRVKDGTLTLGPQGLIRAKRTNGMGYAHQMHQALRSGERFFYVQRLEYCLAPVWRR